MTAAAALFRHHPFGDGGHDAKEFAFAQMAEHFHILIDLRDRRPILRRFRLRFRNFVSGCQFGLAFGAADLIHAGAAITILFALLWRQFACRHKEGRSERKRAHQLSGEGVRVHFGAPGRVEGSTVTLGQ